MYDFRIITFAEIVWVKLLTFSAFYKALSWFCAWACCFIPKTASTTCVMLRALIYIRGLASTIKSIPNMIFFTTSHVRACTITDCWVPNIVNFAVWLSFISAISFKVVRFISIYHVLLNTMTEVVGMEGEIFFTLYITVQFFYTLTRIEIPFKSRCAFKWFPRTEILDIIFSLIVR